MTDAGKPNPGMILINSSHSSRFYSLVEQTAKDALERVPGDVLEVGTHRGGSARVLGRLLIGQYHRALVTVDPWGSKPYPGADYQYDGVDRAIATYLLAEQALNHGITWMHHHLESIEFLERVAPLG